MTGIDLSAEIGDNSVDFQKNMTIQTDDGTQPFIKFLFFVSENETKIQLTSCVIDTKKVICSIIENDEDIGGYTSQTEAVILIHNLSLCVNKPMWMSVPKPINPSKELFLHIENTFEIVFENCDEHVAEEVFDRLVYATSGLVDHFVENAILDDIKSLISAANPMFQTANITRLLGYKPLTLDKYAIFQLKNICELKCWDVGVNVAKELYDAIAGQLKTLVIPSVAIQSLIGELKDRERYVIENRFFKFNKTLEELGAELGLTRERVRQITSKVERKFRASHSKMNLIKAIFRSLKVLCDCDCCFTTSELDKYSVSENGLKFLSEVLGDEYSLFHISDTDYIVFTDQEGKCIWLEYIEDVSRSIPALLLPDEQRSIVKAISSSLSDLGYEISNSIIIALVFRKYVKKGSVLVKKSLRIGDRYEIVLEKFFPDGIRLYQAEDMELFRKGYAALFEDDKIADNDHAVISRVADRCLLIDRGTYILNKKTDLPVDLAQRILDFIEQYPFDMVMTNAIMHKFHADLIAIGVENKYYLHSIIKQHFSNKFSFRRDYVIKGEVTGNFYANITAFVAAHPEGVSFNMLQNHFQGIPETVLYFALSEDDDIIPMYNKMYTHKSNIIFPEQQQVLASLKETVAQEHIVSDEQAFSLLRRNYSDFIANNNISTGWLLFSILRSFFSEEFNFSRPHIIDRTFDSKNGQEALRSSFWGKKRVEIADIKGYAKEKQIYIFDLSKLLDSYNERYFILDKEQLISIDELGYSKDDFTRIEDIVFDALGNQDFSEISILNVVNSLPRANIAITEWLLYSIINRFGTRLTAVTSASQFMKSTPLVFRNGIDIDTVREEFATSMFIRQTVKIDDLSDIDNLIEGIIDIDSIWEEGGQA